MEHASVANCLREEKYVKVVQSNDGDCEEVQCEGYGLEKIISQHERIVYLSGHEHVFSATLGKWSATCCVWKFRCRIA